MLFRVEFVSEKFIFSISCVSFWERISLALY